MKLLVSKTDDLFFLAVPFVLGIMVFVLIAVMAYGLAIDHQPKAPPRTQVVAVCDSRGNTVYTTNTGGIYVLEGCR